MQKEEVPPAPVYQEPSYPPPGYGPAPPTGYGPGPAPPPYTNQPGPPTTYTTITMAPGTSFAPGGNVPVPVGSLVRYDVTPVRILCQHCQAEVVTRTSSKVGVVTFLACGLLVFIGCIFGCCLIPFFVDSLKDTIHSCPNCNRQVGSHRHNM